MDHDHRPKFELETVACPLCRGKGARVVRRQVPDLLNGLEGRFDVVECSDCRFAYTNPRPTPATFGYFFPDHSGHYSPPIRDDKTLGMSFRRKVFRSALLGLGYEFPREATLPRLFDRFIYSALAWHLKNLHIPRWKNGGTLLDVGCSTGSYLQVVKSLGWKVAGVEFNKNMARIARESLDGAVIYDEPFEEVSLPLESFDVVRMGMVIDHLHDPVSALKKIRDLLKPDGRAYFSLVNFAGLESRIFKERAYPLQLPTHLAHFTLETFSKALGGAGLAVSDVAYHAVDRDFIASLKYSGRKRLHALASSPLIRRGFVKPTTFLLAALGQTSRMTVIARKG